MTLTKWDTRFLEMAKLVGSWSKDPSTKAGAVIVGPENEIISVGFNGFPKGMPDSPELYENREEKYSRIVHAEVNAMMFARGPIPSSSTLYTYPFMPCDRCVVQMLQVGIREFVAPKTDAERLERWGAALERTKKYIEECNGRLWEIEVQ